MSKHKGLHSGEEHPCGICSFVGKSKHSINQHFKIHGGKDYPCDSCSYVAKNKKNLSQHKTHKQHQQEKKFICDQCGYRVGYKNL